jgi:predicted GIY-YIG superfamily endonuclease
LTSSIEVAFRDVRDGWSPDRVVADPELNRRFLLRCREFNESASDRVLNLRLLNLRKAGGLTAGERSRATTFANIEDYRFASEIAARFLERREQLSLDTIICDPVLAAEFDAIAGQISPGYSPLQYRWAALNLRKSKRLRPEALRHLMSLQAVSLGRLEEIDFDRLPRVQGLYIFYSAAETLYVGEAQNLRRRIEKHLDHSDNKGLARWFWENGMTNVFLEFTELPEATSKMARRAAERELIQSRRPTFNIQEVR